MFDEPIGWQQVVDHGTGCERHGLQGRLTRLQLETVTVLLAFEAWLLQRRLRTLALRFQAASHNARRIAERLSGHAAIEAVLCSGLPIHPTHPIARQQQQQTGGMRDMLTIPVRACFAAARHVATHTRSFLSSASFGGVERLIEHRGSIEAPGSLVPEHLLRRSAGIEDAEEPIADLDQAMAGARG